MVLKSAGCLPCSERKSPRGKGRERSATLVTPPWHSMKPVSTACNNLAQCGFQGSLPHTSHDALAGRHEAERTQLRATLRKFAAQSCKPRGLEHAAIFTLDAQGHHDLDGSLNEAGRSELFKAWLLRGCSKDVSQSEGFAEHSVQQKPCSPCPNICPQVK